MIPDRHNQGVQFVMKLVLYRYIIVIRRGETKIKNINSKYNYVQMERGDRNAHQLCKQ